MGYSTEFYGYLDITPPLNQEQITYINTFSNTRRMARHVERLGPDPVREAVGLPPGKDGEFFVGSLAKFGQDFDSASVISSGDPPSTQPGLWCQWVVSTDGAKLEWDGGEKFYHYIQWLKYMIESFFKRWSKVLNGEIEWEGEEHDDCGKIVVNNNEVKVFDGQIVYKPRE